MVVEEVGSGVARFARGGDVFGLAPFEAIGAAHAEYLTAPVTNITARPVTIGCLVAAGVPLAALTGWRALIEIAGVAAGQRVLIHRAAGGVGHIAVRLAR